jgi:hypothetical protein
MLHCSHSRINELRFPFRSIFTPVERNFNISMFVHETESNHGYYHTELSPVDGHFSLKFWILPSCPQKSYISKTVRFSDPSYNVQPRQKVFLGPSGADLGCSWHFGTPFSQVFLHHIVRLGPLTSDMVLNHAGNLSFVLKSSKIQPIFYLVVFPVHEGYAVVI